MRLVSRWIGMWPCCVGSEMFILESAFADSRFVFALGDGVLVR